MGDVGYEQRGPVAVLTLQRPEALNAITPDMHREYRTLLAGAEADPAIGVIVVTGAGRGFCAGADMGVLGSMVEGGGGLPAGARTDAARPGYGTHPDFDRPFAYHLGLTKPVVAAINGGTAGIGFVLACYCDIRFAAAGAKLTTGFPPLGLPAEYGLSWLLPRLIGGARAGELLLSGRAILAEEAERIGLVHRVLPPAELLSATIAYATDVAQRCAPGSLAMTKRQLYVDWLRHLGEALDEAVELADAATRGPEFREGVAAFRERRPARFRPEPEDGG